MRIGLIDVDAESRKKVTFPNLAIMKISAWHKAKCDTVEWYSPDKGMFDAVYMAKVFGSEYTHDYTAPINSKKIFRGGVRVCLVCRRWQGSIRQTKRS